MSILLASGEQDMQMDMRTLKVAITPNIRLRLSIFVRAIMIIKGSTDAMLLVIQKVMLKIMASEIDIVPNLASIFFQRPPPALSIQLMARPARSDNRYSRPINIRII
jgi:hypothetical protein